MDNSLSKTFSEFPTHGKRKTIPIILDILSSFIFLWGLIFIISSENNIHLNSLVTLLMFIMIIIGLASFCINAYAVFNWKIENLTYITGKIILTEKNITINDLIIPIDDIKKIYLNAPHTRGAGRGTSYGANNKIEIKTVNNIIAQKFVLENKEKREDLKNYALFLKTKNIPIYIEGIDLK